MCGFYDMMPKQADSKLLERGPLRMDLERHTRTLIGAFIGDWLLPQLGVHFGTGIVALIINAFIGAVILLLILRLVGGGWGYGRRWGRGWR